MSPVPTTWHTTWGVELVVTALAALYLRTALRLRGWPVRRTVSALAALAVVVVTVDSGLDAGPAGRVVPQLLFLVAVPALWLAGRPLELLRRDAPARTAAALDRLRGHGVVRLLAAPPTVLVALALVVVLTLATSRVPGARAQVLALGAGLLFFSTALAPARSCASRIVLLVLGAVVVTVGAVAAGRCPVC